MEQKTYSGTDFIFAILSTVPILGIIFYFLFKNEQPARSKLCGAVALVMIVFGFIGFILRRRYLI